MVNYLMTLGWAPRGDIEIVPWSQIEDEFRLEDVSHSPAFFDLKKLASFNGDYIRASSVDDFIAACDPFLHGDAVPWSPNQFDADVFRAIAPLAQTRLVVLSEIVALVDFFFLESPIIDEAAWIKTFPNNADATGMIAAAIEAFTAVTAWEHETLKTVVEQIGADRGLKLGKAQAPVRVAVTGRTVGPPLFEALEILGRDEVLSRLAVASERLSSP
jgi:glutamyl-tRNA synthetase